MRLTVSSKASRFDAPAKPVYKPYDSSAPTDATDTSGYAKALGSPRPKLTVVTGFLPSGSIAFVVFPSQPSDDATAGSAVCQMSIERK